ncbi:hypothetical protein [Roseisolibacter agri]|uniref:hypothetical protein n=1 Tax=Roseisolibacter agri TaxID=2014610 RepID=UPI0024E07BEE|nr:hypothetical protein [Roseisolibacter agri]
MAGLLGTHGLAVAGAPPLVAIAVGGLAATGAIATIALRAQALGGQPAVPTHGRQWFAAGVAVPLLAPAAVLWVATVAIATRAGCGTEGTMVASCDFVGSAGDAARRAAWATVVGLAPWLLAIIAVPRWYIAWRVRRAPAQDC